MDMVLNIFDILYAPQAWFLSLPRYVSMSVVGLMITAGLTLSGFVLARLGYKPLWALVLLIPYANVIALWVLAYTRYPIEKNKTLIIR